MAISVVSSGVFGTPGSTTASASIDCGSGSNRALLAVTASRDASDYVTSVSIDGSPLTFLQRQAYTGELYASAFEMADPPSGTQTISLTANAADEHYVAWMVIQSSDATLEHVIDTYNTGTGATSTINVSHPRAAAIISIFANEDSNITTAGTRINAHQTSIYNTDMGAWTLCASTAVIGSGGTTAMKESVDDVDAFIHFVLAWGEGEPTEVHAEANLAAAEATALSVAPTAAGGASTATGSAATASGTGVAVSAAGGATGTLTAAASSANAVAPAATGAATATLTAAVATATAPALTSTGGSIASLDPASAAINASAIFVIQPDATVTVPAAAATLEAPTIDATAGAIAPTFPAATSSATAQVVIGRGGSRGILVAVTSSAFAAAPTGTAGADASLEATSASAEAIALAAVTITFAELAAAVSSAIAVVPTRATGGVGVGATVAASSAVAVPFTLSFTVSASAALPSYRSRIFRLESHIYLADRENTLGADITDEVTFAEIDLDIDRPGSKGLVALTLVNPTADLANAWVAPVVRVVPESGSVVESQLGLYQLAQPEITKNAAGQTQARVFGDDIINQFAAWPIGTAVTAAQGANAMNIIRTELAALGFTRLALPDESKTLTKALSHRATDSWLKRWNEILAAIGYHALHATFDGRPTSRPLRDARTDTATRTYTVGFDSAIVSPVNIRQSTGNLYNVVVAIKEDYQTGTAMVAVARNDNPSHPWSTAALGREIASSPIVVTEAVDQETLQSIADDALARASMQETLALNVLPDAILSIYDIIEMAGADEPETGRWATEGLVWGLTAESPLVKLRARRTYTTGSPT